MFFVGYIQINSLATRNYLLVATHIPSLRPDYPISHSQHIFLGYQGKGIEIINDIYIL
jgi:hypothetical protein